MAKKPFQLVRAPAPMSTPPMLDPFHTRVAELRYAHLQQQLANTVLTVTQVLAERDAFKEQCDALRAELAAVRTELAAAITGKPS